MKNLFKGRILLLLTFVLSAGILYSANISVGYLNRINTLQSELAVQTKQNTELDRKLKETEEKLQKEIEVLKGQLEEANRKLEIFPQIDATEIKKLQQKGLTDPVKELKEDLMKRNDLIPYKGVLGGTMGFYSEDNIHIISSEWAAAYFEDGHINGIMLLRYNILKDGRIRWNVIDSILYQ